MSSCAGSAIEPSGSAVPPGSVLVVTLRVTTRTDPIGTEMEKGIMEIRESTEQDIPRIMEIYDHARRFMAEHGNPNQWGPTNWPPRELIRQDIRSGRSYVCVHEGRIVGTFYYDFGRRIEPTYETIEDGEWIGGDTYGVVHRIASDGSVKGTGSFCLEWAIARCSHLRIDTHGDNVVMQGLLARLGFTRCGIIHVEEDDYPRLAYELVR